MLDVEYRPGEIYLARIEIHPDHQGRGIGTRLIRTLMAEARGKGQALVLDVLTVNRRAQALYRRLGMSEVATSWTGGAGRTTFRTQNVGSGAYGGDMTDPDYPWEPPMAGTEAEHLTGALDRLRTTFRFKADDLDAAGLQVSIGASSLTLGGLLKHLAVCEDNMFTVRLSGAPIGAPWEGTDWNGDSDWELTSAADDTPQQLYDLWDGAVERSRARLSEALANGGLGQSVDFTSPDGRHASLRRLVCDLIEEYGRHTGHADLIREAVDGRVGEDPPAGWRPRAGRYRVDG